MKLYLDNSFLNRPFDDPLAGMNTKEGAVLFDIIRFAKEGKVELVHSAMIELENTANDIAARKSFVASVTHLAAAFQNLSDDIVRRAQELATQRLEQLDQASYGPPDTSRTRQGGRQGGSTSTARGTRVHHLESHPARP